MDNRRREMKTFICEKHGIETDGKKHCIGTPVEEVYKCEKCGAYFDHESMWKKCCGGNNADHTDQGS